MCMKTPKPPAPPAPPPLPKNDAPVAPVISEQFGAADTLSTKRRGRNALRINMSGLNIPT